MLAIQNNAQLYTIRKIDPTRVNITQVLNYTRKRYIFIQFEITRSVPLLLIISDMEMS